MTIRFAIARDKEGHWEAFGDSASSLEQMKEGAACDLYPSKSVEEVEIFEVQVSVNVPNCLGHSTVAGRVSKNGLHVS